VGFSFLLIRCEKTHIAVLPQHEASLQQIMRQEAAMKPQDRPLKVEPSSYSKRCPSDSPRQPASAVCDVMSLSGRDWHKTQHLTISL